MTQALIQVYTDQAALANAGVDLFIALAQEAISSRGKFSVALSGGSTPKQLYADLAEPGIQNQLAWESIHLFFGDERHVKPDHPDSNYRMVQETLFSKVSLPEANIHRVRTEMDARLAAFDYEERLRVFFDLPWPQFDLLLLGMGADGHTASLFPKTAGLNEEHRWFIAQQVPSQDSWRLTLTKNAINAARQIVVLVSGLSKAEILAEVLTGPHQPAQKPIQMIKPVDGKMMWMIDGDAASQLPDLLTNQGGLSS
jgi:6-phosphogluconolactonase